jgi:hypothetical protein
MAEEMTATDWIRAAFGLQKEARPGDVTISVQDDSMACMIFQNGRMVGMGSDIEEAAQNFYDEVLRR